MANRTVVVTGAGGFVGLPLVSLLVRSGFDVRAAVRRESANLAGFATPERLRTFHVGDLESGPDWSPALEGAGAVVHLAARVHEMRARPGATDAFRRINVDGTLHLAHNAARAGVRRLVFVSSVKAGTDAGDPYAESKAEAESGLIAASKQLGIGCVIVRPPLVYGPRVRANFLRLLHLVDSGIPLPLGGIRNRRSLIFVGNLVHALRACVEHPAAVGRSFAVADGEDVSTPELIRRLALALGKPARLFSVPATLLAVAARACGQTQAYARLAQDLSVDSFSIRETLGWSPPYSMSEGLAETAHWYHGYRGRPTGTGDADPGRG